MNIIKIRRSNSGQTFCNLHWANITISMTNKQPLNAHNPLPTTFELAHTQKCNIAFAHRWNFNDNAYSDDPSHKPPSPPTL